MKFPMLPLLVETRGSRSATFSERKRAAQKKLKDVMAEFQADFKAKYQPRVPRGRREQGLYSDKRRADQETIDQLIETGNSEQIQKAIEEHCRGHVMGTLTEIQERHEAAIDVEKNLLELQQVQLLNFVLCQVMPYSTSFETPLLNFETNSNYKV